MNHTRMSYTHAPFPLNLHTLILSYSKPQITWNNAFSVSNTEKAKKKGWQKCSESFSALEQTHCALVTCDSKWATVTFFYSSFWISTKCSGLTPLTGCWYWVQRKWVNFGEKWIWLYGFCFKREFAELAVQSTGEELFEHGGGLDSHSPLLPIRLPPNPVPNKPYVFCGRKASRNRTGCSQRCRVLQLAWRLPLPLMFCFVALTTWARTSSTEHQRDSCVRFFYTASTADRYLRVIGVLNSL